jgi:TPR repeat protein
VCYTLVMFMHIIVLGLYLLLASVNLAFAGFDEGVEAYDVGDYPTAFNEFRTVAEQGNAAAQFNVGLMYAQGWGVSRDYGEAAKWWRQAAEQGCADAQYNLGVTYGDGRGVPQDDAQAVKWYRRAAEQGRARAQFNLGVMYYKGKGVTQDYVQALMWLNLSGLFGATNARESRDRVADKMTPAQIAEAQKLAREWIENYQGQ